MTDNVPNELETILEQLSTDQIRFLIARNDTTTDKAAAAQVGLGYSTVKMWPHEVKNLIDRGLRLMAQDGLVTALHLRRRSLARAMAVKAEGLDSRDERIKQGAATEIIEWELGKAPEKLNVSGEVAIGFRDELERRLARLAAGGEAPDVPGEPERE